MSLGGQETWTQNTLKGNLYSATQHIKKHELSERV